METTDIIKEQGHILLPIGDKRALLDTGSPVSVAPEPFEFLGMICKVPTNIRGVTPQKMADLAGFPIDMLIGCDILSRYTVRLRWNDGCMDVGEDIPEGPVQSPLEALQGRPVFPVRLQGKPVKSILDTGAHLAYIDPDLVSGQAASGSRDDFHIDVGHYTTDIYTVPTVLDDTTINIEYGIMPNSLASCLGPDLDRAKISAVIGTQLLEHYDCTISWTRKIISWSQVNKYTSRETGQ